MKKSTHIIRQQVLELSLESDQGVREIQEEVSDVFKSSILPRMERLFDSLSQEGQVLKIDTLELDLGDIDLRYLKDDLPLKVEQLLEEQITKILYQQQEGIPGEVRSVSVNWSDSKLETFQFLLRSGIHPWNSPFKDQSISQLFEELAPKNASQVRDILRRELGHEYVRKRVTFQFNEDQFRALIAMLSEVHSPAGLSLLQGLQLIGNHLSILSDRVRLWNIQVKEILLQSVTFQGKAPATTVALVQQVLGNLLISWAGIMRRANANTYHDTLTSLISQMKEAFRRAEIRTAFSKVGEPLKEALEHELDRRTRSKSSVQGTANKSKNLYQDNYKSDYQVNKLDNLSPERGGVSAEFQNFKVQPSDTSIENAPIDPDSGDASENPGIASEEKLIPETEVFSDRKDGPSAEDNSNDGVNPDQHHVDATDREGAQQQSSSKGADLSQQVEDQSGSEAQKHTDEVTSAQWESKNEASSIIESTDKRPIDSRPEDKDILGASKTISNSHQHSENEPNPPNGEVGDIDDPEQVNVSSQDGEVTHDSIISRDKDSEQKESSQLQDQHPQNLKNGEVQKARRKHSEQPGDKDRSLQEKDIIQETEAVIKEAKLTSPSMETSAERKSSQSAFESQQQRVEVTDEQQNRQEAGSSDRDKVIPETDPNSDDGISEVTHQKDTQPEDPDARTEEETGNCHRKTRTRDVTQSENIRPMNRIVPHPEDHFVPPLWRKPPMIIEEAQINNAGLALLWPYLPILFKGMNWVKDGAFVSEEYQFRAIHFLQYMVSGAVATEEQELTFNKLLVGMLPEVPVPFDVSLTHEELEEAEHLLKTVLESWTALKSGSVELLRQTFLQKEGLLKKDMASWKLYVKRSAFDILLDRLPWSYSVVKLPWMDNLINVEW